MILLFAPDPLANFGGLIPPMPGSPSSPLFGQGDTPPPLVVATSANRQVNLKRGAMALREATRKGIARGNAALRKVVAAASNAMGDLAGKLVSGLLRLAGWFTGSLDQLVSHHFGGLLALTNGATPPDPALADLEARVNQQAGYLARFRKAIADGLPLGPGAIARAASYGDAIWSTAGNVFRGMHVATKAEERRFLGSAVLDHCEVCPEQAGLGWQPIGTLPEIGDTPCGIHCGCRFAYR